MNLTDQQKDLLRLLVSKHESTGGAQSLFVRRSNTTGICYPGGDSVGVAYHDSDLRRLRRERLVALIPVAHNPLRGNPTDGGIAIVRRGFFSKRVMKEYEDRCPLLAADVRGRLNQRGEEREAELSRQVEFAAAAIRERREELKQITDDPTRGVPEAALLQETASLRRGIIEVAENVATEGVREFANGLLSSQGRLGVHAFLLREYTARFVSGIRHWLNASHAFQTEPLLPWRQDSITQMAIQTCEDVLAETKTIEDGGAPDKKKIEGVLAGQNENEPRTWPPIVQDWEALKSARGIITGEHERMPDADLRSILAGQYLIKPEDVTDGQIEYAALELCRHYGRVQIIPPAAPELSSAVDEFQDPRPIPDAAFWKEREEAFHRHDTGANQVLGATWFSEAGHWAFHAGPGPVSPAESVLAFKPLAIEAAKGIVSTRGAKSWVDWLDLLRRAKDEGTAKFLYAKNCPGSCVRSERELERLIEAGEDIPAGGLIEFAETAGGGVERRMYWDTNAAVIENVFKNSANCCSRLRSLAPHPISNEVSPQTDEVYFRRV